jgi:hypothetical protein
MADTFNREWLIEKSIEVLTGYSEGITIRQLYYRLVAAHGMTNDIIHYKRTVEAVVAARWAGTIDFDQIIDRERSMSGSTEADTKVLSDEIETGKEQIRAWMENYRLERWSNQPKYIEVWIEKKALQGVFEAPCREYRVGLAPCKGYSSLTFIHDAKYRFERAAANGKELHILYFGDYDPSGKDIPRSLEANVRRMGVDINVHSDIALTEAQIRAMGLPGVPPKKSDSRTANWTGGDVVELDAVEPKTLSKIVRDEIKKYFDQDLYDDLKAGEKIERLKYQKALKEFVEGL